MKPGARTRPVASITDSPFPGVTSPISVTWLKSIRTFALCSGPPVPSANWALTIRKEDDFCWGKSGKSTAQENIHTKQSTASRLAVIGLVSREKGEAVATLAVRVKCDKATTIRVQRARQVRT